MFNIDLNENNRYILRQFYTEPPLIIISMPTINAVTSNGITVSRCLDFKLIPFSRIVSHTKDNASKWLHERLTIVSSKYRFLTEEGRNLREQYALYYQKMDNEYRWIKFVNEEKERQLINYGIDFHRIWKRKTSASPEFIAQFRLMNHEIVEINDLEIIDTSCSVCLEKFQLDQ